MVFLIDKVPKTTPGGEKKTATPSREQAESCAEKNKAETTNGHD